METRLTETELITREVMFKHKRVIANGNMRMSELIELVKEHHKKKHRVSGGLTNKNISTAILRFGPCGEDSIWDRLPAPLPPYEVRETRGIA